MVLEYLRQRGFKPVKLLGEGGFGQVWLVATDSGGHAAVKCLTNMEGDSLSRFRREVGVVMDHDANPHVVRILDHELDANPPYYVMEYCPTGSLAAWIADRRPWTEVALALVHVLKGLADLHARGGFHRDIKPHNLLLAGDADILHVKVADFGLARDPARNSSMTALPGGTQRYQAPEVLGNSDHTAKADIYSLGITALELLTGSTDLRQLKATQCPAKLRLLVRGMVSPDADERPSPEQALKQLTTLLVPTDVANRVRNLSDVTDGSREIQRYLALRGQAAGVGIGVLLVAAAAVILALILLKPKGGAGGAGAG